MKQWHMPIGYKMVDGKIVLDSEKSEVVKKIFTNYINGSSLTKIAEELSVGGFPNSYNKPSWNHGSVGRILENVKYLGDTLYPRIIDEKTFELVQKRRERIAAGFGRDSQSNIRKKQGIFNNKIKCGECGGIYRQYITRRGKTEDKTEWKCKNQTRQARIKCTNLILKERDIESIFISATNKIISRMWMLDKQKEKQPPKKPPNINIEIRNIEARIKELEEEEQFSSKELARLVFKRAQAYYNISKVGDYDYNTRKIKEELMNKKPLIEFKEELFIKIVNQILIYRDGRIMVEFINGITLEEDYENIGKDE